MSKADLTRQFIIEKTAPLFNAKGYAGTSLNDMMDATGLSKGSIYGNFDGKDDVAVAAFDHNFGTVEALLRSRMQVRQSMIDKLMVYPETYRDFLKIPYLKGGCPLLNTSVEADDTHPVLKQKALNALKLWQSSIEKFIAVGIERGEIKPGTDATRFAILLMSLIEGALMQAKVTERQLELDITMDFVTQMINDLKT